MKMRYHVVGYALLVVIGSGCSEERTAPEEAKDPGSEYVVQADSVGPYQIGKSTLEEILGTDTAEARERFGDAGLFFEFSQGKELTGVTITSTTYALENGLTIGSTSTEVTDKLGKPRASQIDLEPTKISVDALVYDEYWFFLDPSRKVKAIRIGN